METLKKICLSLGIITLLSLCVSSLQAQGRSVSLQVFYDELSYHGDWINNPDYGYVWRPNVDRDFRPYYTNGRWVMTEYGNTWVSNYSWGWAPFHYGRWFYDDYDGWLWLPDVEWGPAWVDWRTGSGYYGWAPLGPRMGISVTIGRRYYPDFYWVFIPQKYIYYNSYNRYWNPTRNVTIIRNTTIINNVYVNNNVNYVSGPSVRDVRRATRQSVTVYRISDASRPSAARVERNTLNVYRPQVERGNDAAPSRTVSQRPSRGVEQTNSRSVRPEVGKTNNTTTETTVSSRPQRSETTTPRNVESRSGRESNIRTITPSGTRAGSANTERVQPATRTQVERIQRESNSRPQATGPRSTERSSTRSTAIPQRETRTQSAPPQRVERLTPSRVERPLPAGRSNRGGMSSGSSRTERPGR